MEVSTLSILKSGSIGSVWFSIRLIPTISFNNFEETTNRKMRTLFYSYLIRAGVFLAPFHHGYIMYRHSEKDLENVIDRIESSFNYLKKNI